MKKIKLKKIFKKYKIIFLVFFAFFFTSNVFASSLNLNPQGGSFSVGESIAVRVRVSSKDTSINAVSAVISYSNNTLSLTSISKAGSIITLWPVEPSFSNQSGRANLEGVVLNGYTGNSGKIVTLNFKAIQEGEAFVRFSSGSILANDGQGTNTLTSSSESNFTIIKKQTTLPNVVYKKPAVIDSVNTIKVEEIKDPNLAPNQAQFLLTPPRPIKGNYSVQIDSEDIFSFADDGSGIFKTPVLESGNHTIRITAYDQNGNLMSGMTEFITMQSYLDYEKVQQKATFVEKNIEIILINFAIIIVVLILVVFFLAHVISKNKKKLKQRLKESRNAVAKTFAILEEDENEESQIIRKLKNHKILTDDEESDLVQFHKDLSDAKSVINEEISKILHD